MGEKDYSSWRRNSVTGHPRRVRSGVGLMFRCRSKLERLMREEELGRGVERGVG